MDIDVDLRCSSPRSPNMTELSNIEMSRILSINERTLCISFPFLSSEELPSAESLMATNGAIQSVVFARPPLPWCFMIFTSKDTSKAAEKDFNDYRMIGSTTIFVNESKIFIPWKIEDLALTRDPYSLAVHGIASNKTSGYDLKKVFKNAKSVKIATRGGTAFLNYATRDDCENDFFLSEDVEINGVKVVVMFAHDFKRKGVMKQEHNYDLRIKLSEGLNTGSWEQLLTYIEESEEVKSLVDSDSLYGCSLEEIKEVILASELRVDKMRYQFQRSVLKSESEDVKVSWLDGLVSSIIHKLGLAFNEISTFERGPIRIIIEVLWSFFELEKNSDNMESESGREPLLLSTDGISPNEKEYTIIADPLGGFKRKYNPINLMINNKKSYDSGVPSLNNSDDIYHHRLKVTNDRYTTDHMFQRSKSSTPVFSEYISDIVEENASEDSIRNRVALKSVAIVPDRMTIDEEISKIFSKESRMLIDNNFTLESLEKFLLEKFVVSQRIQPDVADIEVKRVIECIKYDIEDGCEGEMINACDWKTLLDDMGFSSVYINTLLVAEYLFEWFSRAVLGDTSSVAEKLEKSSPIKEETQFTILIREEETNLSENEGLIPSEIMQVSEGFPRMALVMAFYILNRRGLEEKSSKDLARAMVGVWITYGFSYDQLKEISCDRWCDPKVKSARLFNLLLSRFHDGFVKPKSFGFSYLVKITLFYFSHGLK